MTSPKHPSRIPETSIAALRAAARLVAEHAYAPYSNFRVGAALLLGSPEPLYAPNILGGPELLNSPEPLNGPEQPAIISGCNVENASYRLSTCAEQTAIVSAIALHGPHIKIRGIAIANLNQALSAPCGACRQMIFEFGTPDTWVFLPSLDNSSHELRLADLLPLAFELKVSRR